MSKYNQDVLSHYGIQNTEKTAGRGGIDDLEKILGPKKWREITILRRNLHGASPLSTKGADLLWDCIEALAKRVQMDPKTTEALNQMRWLNDGHKPAQNMASILDLAKTLGVRANYTTQDLIAQFGNRLGYTRVLYRQVKSVLKKARLLDKVEMQGKSTDWAIECPDERTKNKVTKAMRAEGIALGGYRTGWGGWVLSQTYQPAGDWNDPSSRHHYASQEKTAALKWKVDDHGFAKSLEKVLRDTLDEVGYRGKVVQPTIGLDAHGISVGFRIGGGAWGAKHPEHAQAVKALKDALGSKWETNSSGGMTDVSFFARTQ